MKVLVFTNAATPYNRHLWRELERLGVDLTVCHESTPAAIGRPWEIELSPAEHVGSGPFHDLGHLRERPDVIVCSGGYTRVRQVVRLLAGRAAAPPLLWWGERLGAPSLVSSLARRQLRGADAVLAIGTWAVPSYREVVAPSTPVHVFPYVTTADLPAPQRTPDPVVGFCGRLIGWRNAALAIQVVGRLEDGCRPRLELVGDGPERERLARMAEVHGVEVRFLGELPPDDVAAHRRSWWAQMVPSSELDGWGLVVPEALAGGVPVLASDLVGSAVDLLGRGGNGRVCRTVHEWELALREALEPVGADERSTAAISTARAIDAVAGAAFLREILDSPRGPERNFLAEHLPPC